MGILQWLGVLSPFRHPNSEGDSPIVNKAGDAEHISNDDDAYESLMKVCRVAGVSFAVMHQGQLIRDVSGGRGRKNAADPDSPVPDINSMYTMASVSKIFVSIAVGLLEHDGKLDLAQPITKYVPEFVPKEDSRVGSVATLEDFLRHSSGLDNPVVSLLGPKGKSIVQAGDFMGVLNDTPNTWYGTQWFGFWCYSNVAFGLLAIAIERVSQMPFSAFVQERILDPLGMKNTAVCSSQLRDISNLIRSGAQLSDGSWQALDHEWTNEHNTPVLAMVGIRSSVRDLLILSSAFIDGQDPDPAKPRLELLASPEANPLRLLKPVFQKERWVFPGPTLGLFNNEMRYHFGWARVEMPSTQAFWGAWLQTSGPPSSGEPSTQAETEMKAAPEAKYNTAILGKDSGKRVLYKATGVSFCGTVSMNVFPETRSAVVVCSSGLNCGDAANFIAAVLIQNLFDLQPRIDIQAWADAETKAQIRRYDDSVEEFRSHQDPSKPESPHSDYLGEYRGLGIVLTIRKSASGGLEVCFNGREDIVRDLKHYSEDRYSYGPESRDEWLRDGWLDWDYYLVGILTFHRDQESGRVREATWVWENGAKPHSFTRF